MEPYHKQIARTLNEERLLKEANDPKTVQKLREQANLLQKQLAKLRQGNGTIEDYLATVESAQNTLGHLNRLALATNSEIREQLKAWLDQDQGTVKQILYAATIIKEDLATQLTELSRVIKRLQEVTGNDVLHS